MAQTFATGPLDSHSAYILLTEQALERWKGGSATPTEAPVLATVPDAYLRDGALEDVRR